MVASRVPPEQPYVSRVESLGVHLPERCRSTEELVSLCDPPLGIDLVRVTGIRERRVCARDEGSHALALAAARHCLEHSSHPAEELEMVVSCSVSKGLPDESFQFEPPLSLHLKQSLGAVDALNFDVANACAGMLTGVAIVNDFIRRGVVRRGMVCSGEFVTCLSNTATRAAGSSRERQLASLTLGDAGAAVILERCENGSRGISACELVTLPQHSELCVAKPCRDTGRWAMYTDGPTLQRVAIDAVGPTVEKALEKSGLTPDQIDVVIPHQTSMQAFRAGKRILRECMEGFRGSVINNLELLGNTASTTHFLALHRCLRDGTLRPGAHVLLLCFASGIVVGAVVLTIDDLAEKYASDD